MPTVFCVFWTSAAQPFDEFRSRNYRSPLGRYRFRSRRVGRDELLNANFRTFSILPRDTFKRYIRAARFDGTFGAKIETITDGEIGAELRWPAISA